MSRASLTLLFFATLWIGCDGRPGDPVLPQADYAIVLSSGGFGASGAVNTVKLSDRSVALGIDTTIDQDNAIRTQDGRAYVLNRGVGSIYVYDTTSWASPIEIKTGDADHSHSLSFPQDLHPIPGTTKIFVTLFGNDADHAVGVVDTARPEAGVVTWIALPAAAADPDGKPEPNVLHYCDGRLYATLSDLDTTGTYAPTGPARLAVLDTAGDRLLSVIQLAGQNPYSIAAESSDCAEVLIADSGAYGRAPDGTAGIERVNLRERKSLGLILTDLQLAGRPSTVDVASRSLAFMTLYFDLQPSPGGGPDILSSVKVVAFDPSTARVLGDVTEAAGYIPFARVTPDGQLFVGVDFVATTDPDGKLAPGLYVGKADGAPLAGPPIDLGQNPYSIAFR